MRSKADRLDSRSRLVALLVPALAWGCTSEPLEFAEWTIPVAEGVEAHSYAAVHPEERQERIELAEELRIGEADRPGHDLYRPTDVAVAADGRIFVHDTGNRRIQVFDAGGAYLRTIGREGPGPGELAGSGSIVVAGDRLLRSGDSRLSTWTLEGEHLGDAAIDFAQRLESLHALPDGSVLASWEDRGDDGTITTTFAAVSPDLERLRTFARFTHPDRTKSIISDAGFTIVLLPGPQPSVAVSAAGEIYLTSGEEYQVLSLGTDGSPRWALRTAWPRLPVDGTDREAAVLRRVDDTAPEDLDVEWPELNPALASTGDDPAMRVDGHGHLYVWPFVRDAETLERPVDVYSADGKRLFAGRIAAGGWQAALGDAIYRLVTDPATEEQVVVRYRLEEPF